MWQKGKSRQLKLLPYLSVHNRRRCGADDLEVDAWPPVADVATAHYLRLLSCRAAALAGEGGAVEQSQPVETDPSQT